MKLTFQADERCIVFRQSQSNCNDMCEESDYIEEVPDDLVTEIFSDIHDISILHMNYSYEEFRNKVEEINETHWFWNSSNMIHIYKMLQRKELKN